jgi:hypothetical protein
MRGATRSLRVAASASAARSVRLSAAQRPRSGRDPEQKSCKVAADAGNAALELVILAPIIVFLIGFVIAAGRTSIAQGSVAAAAREAARQASIRLSASEAQQVAESTARAALSGDGLHCNPTVTLNLTGFDVPIGRPAHVSATVTCTVPLSDLLVPGMPGSRTLRATFTSPLDPFRTRALGNPAAGAVW